MQAQAVFRFGPFRLDVHDECLWRGHDVIPLRHKTLGVVIEAAFASYKTQAYNGPCIYAMGGKPCCVWPATIPTMIVPNFVTSADSH
jgi:hypothetical protein